MLTREQIDAANDLATREVDVPEWGGPVLVRMMSGAEREGYEKAVTKEPASAVSLLVAMTLCDEAGKPLYGAGSVAAVARKGVPALMKVFRAAMDLNRIAAEATDAAEGESAAIQSNI